MTEPARCSAPPARRSAPWRASENDAEASHPGRNPIAVRLLALQRAAGNCAVAAAMSGAGTRENCPSVDHGTQVLPTAVAVSRRELPLHPETLPVARTPEEKRILPDVLPVQPTKSHRPAGISEKLARARWAMKKRAGVTFQQWKKGYEAQHIIPYAVAAKLKLPLDRINKKWNGMMLPSGRKSAAKPLYKAASRFLSRPRHILKGWSHPKYSSRVEDLLRNYMKLHKLKTLGNLEMKKIADFLRGETKALPSANAIDQMTFDVSGKQVT